MSQGEVPHWALLSSLPFFIPKPQHGALGVGERVLFSSTTVDEKFQTYGKTERILQ